MSINIYLYYDLLHLAKNIKHRSLEIRSSGRIQSKGTYVLVFPIFKDVMCFIKWYQMIFYITVC